MSDNIKFKSVSFHLSVSKSIFEFGESADIESEGFSLHNTIRFLGKIKTFTDEDVLTIEYTNDKGEKINLFHNSNEEDFELHIVSREKFKSVMMGELSFLDSIEGGYHDRFFNINIALGKTTYDQIYQKINNDIKSINKIYISALLPLHKKTPPFVAVKWDINKYEILEIETCKFITNSLTVDGTIK
jgi:hypothetical protein